MSVVVFSENFAESSWCLNELAIIAERRERLSRLKVVVVLDNVETQRGFGEATLGGEFEIPPRSLVPGVLDSKFLALVYLSNCPKLTLCPELNSLEGVLKILDLGETPLRELPSAVHKTFEQHDDDDDDVDDTNDAVRIESLRKLTIERCPFMDCRSIPRLSKFPRLRILSIGEIGSNISDESGSQQDHDQLLEGLDNLGELVELEVSGLAKLERLPSPSKLSKLRKLTVYDLLCLREIAGLEELKSLKRLNIFVLPIGMETETDTSPGRSSKGSTSSANDGTSEQPSYSKASTSAVFVDSDSEPLPNVEYEVFLNFRGPDTRENVTDILYRFLAHWKIHTFRDDDELRKGEGIWPNLVKAIGQSKISVPIFSPRYAESKWCLKELAEIVEHRKREKGHVVLPIFYEVDPGHVRHQTGPYENAFQQHKENNFDETTIQSWKAALNEVGNLKGWHIKPKPEVADVADVADAVYKVVWSHLIKNNNTLETDELVGIGDRVEQVVDMLDLGTEGVNVVGIHGMGGIGKTTLATAVYNQVSKCFDRYSFVKDTRETQTQTDGALILQKKLVSDILMMDSVGSGAKKIIRERVAPFKILVVLDDVDEKFDFEEVLGNLKSFASGSRFIITSRDIKVLMRLSAGQNKLYEVQAMNPSCSLQLFCKHAFKKDFPLSGFEVLSKEIVSTTGGLPLTLKVLGSCLLLEKEVVWKDKLEQLRQMPERGVMDRLIISYNALGHEAQQIFLDIACFHIGENREKVSYMWSDCKYHPGINVNVLVQRSMLKIGDSNELQMHDQLRDMGREIVRRENPERPEMRSRIWLKEEANEVLVNNKGTNHVRAISGYSEHTLGSECFTDMTELRYFEGIYSKLNDDFSHLLPNLKWMHLRYSWHATPMESRARFNMKNMIIFDVTGYAIDYIPTKEAKKLKFLNLGNFRKMSKFPEFPESLEMLHLSRFFNEEEDMELGNLHNLKVLILEDCTLGRINGGTIGMMKELRELQLINIRCDFDSFRRVIADITELSSLEILVFLSLDLAYGLEGIKLPKSLKVVQTTSSFDNFSELLDLEELNVSSSSTMELVISPASKLKLMKLFCRTWISMDLNSTMLPSSLTTLDIYLLQSARIPNLKNLSNLTELSLCKCPYLQEIQGVGGLKSLQILEMKDMEKLANIQGLGNLMSSSNCKLIHVEIVRCPLLRALQTFEHDDDDDVDDTNDAVRIETLRKLTIEGCPLMDCRSIPKLSKFPRLRELSIWGIGSEINDESGSQQDHDQLLEGLDNLGELVKLRVVRLGKLERLPSLSKLTKLTDLIVSNLPCLREIVGLGELESLQELEVSDCISLERFPIEGLTNLAWLMVYNLPCLREILGLGKLKSLKELTVSCCISLERLPIEGLHYSNMRRIQLDLRRCTNFTNVDSDLSPLTTEEANQLGTKLTIRWPNEPVSEECDGNTWLRGFE
ncbi:Disease resistance protein L6 [Linum grandiflorum]